LHHIDGYCVGLGDGIADGIGLGEGEGMAVGSFDNGVGSKVVGA